MSAKGGVEFHVLQYPNRDSYIFTCKMLILGFTFNNVDIWFVFPWWFMIFLIGLVARQIIWVRWFSLWLYSLYSLCDKTLLEEKGYVWLVLFFKVLFFRVMIVPVILSLVLLLSL